jgi:hypothetical protein
VAMISLGAWLVGVYVSDNYQTRLSRQRRRMDAPGPALDEAGGPTASIPGQRRDAGQPEPEPGAAPAPETTPETVAARGRHARPAEYYAAADFYGVADYKAAEKTPAGSPETSARGAADPETGGQADAPTRPDLPAQPAQPASTGRHAMPAQRSGDSDRAERTYAGPDADHEDDQDQQ